MKNTYGNSEFWSEYWEKENRHMNEFMFSDLIDQYIDWKNIHSYMEIGGAPGSIMSYMAKIHKLEVSTVDFCDEKILVKFLEAANVPNYHVYNKDFRKFDISAHAKKYDVVASWGFVEHFDLDISGELIQRHKEMVADNGYLIIELPNIRKMNWLIYRIFNYNLLKIHNIKTMDLNFIKREVMKGKEFEILYADYYLTSFFGYNSSNEFFNKHQVIRKVFLFIQYLSKQLHINNIPNQFFSPYIVLVARRV